MPKKESKENKNGMLLHNPQRPTLIIDIFKHINTCVCYKMGMIQFELVFLFLTSYGEIKPNLMLLMSQHPQYF